MSIATEITRLQNAKASIKTSIENKGVVVPSNAKLDTYDTYIDSIEGGLDIQNGRLVNYKSVSGTIPAGTFIKLENVISSSNLSTLTGKSYTSTSPTLCNIIKMSDTRAVICTTGYEGGIRNYLTLVSINDSGFSILGTTLTLSNNPYYTTQNPVCAKLDNTHMVVVYQYKPAIEVYDISGDYLNKVKSYAGNKSYNEQYSKSNLMIQEDDTKFNLFWAYNGSGNTVLASYFTISKSDYTITFIVDRSTQGGMGSYYFANSGITVENGSKRFIFYGIPSSGDALLSYTIFYYDENANSLYNGGSGRVGNALASAIAYANLNNRKFIVYKQGTNLKAYEISGVSTVVNSYTLAEGITISDDYFQNEIIDSNINILTYKETSTGTMYARTLYLSNGNLQLGEASPLGASNSISENRASIICGNNTIKINNNLFNAFMNKVGIFQISNNMMIPIQSDAIRITPATGIIQGITTSDSTTTTAGDTYLLDN